VKLAEVVDIMDKFDSGFAPVLEKPPESCGPFSF
jgi:hypothetical protein